MTNTQFAQTLAQKLIDDGGFSVRIRDALQLRFSEIPEAGYMVAIRSSERQYSGSNWDNDTIEHYLFEISYFESVGLVDPDDYFGGWVDKSDCDRLYLDISRHVVNVDDALQLGEEQSQKSIWDCENAIALYLADYPDSQRKRHVDNVQPHSTGEYYPLSTVTIGDIRQGIGRVEIQNLRTGETRHVEHFGPYHVSPENLDCSAARSRCIDWAKWYSQLFLSSNGKEVA